MNTNDTVLIPAQVGDKRILIAATPIRRPTSGGEREVSIYGGAEHEVSVSALRDLGGKMDEVWGAIAGLSTRIAEKLGQLKAKKVEVEFGVEIGVESGELTAVLVKGTGTASLKITVEWS